MPRVRVIRPLRSDVICTDSKSLLLKEQPQISILRKECFLTEIQNPFHLYLYSLSSHKYTDVPLHAPLSYQTLREALERTLTAASFTYTSVVQRTNSEL